MKQAVCNCGSGMCWLYAAAAIADAAAHHPVSSYGTDAESSLSPTYAQPRYMRTMAKATTSKLPVPALRTNSAGCRTGQNGSMHSAKTTAVSLHLCDLTADTAVCVYMACTALMQY
eukprot:GHUV01041058.1.p1 GENE.GHUV01041058.1~~GHUV01041058.1.p1  ORF type:complete len:116 (+),score=17.13 GHUV01041058.1:167-514(+)